MLPLASNQLSPYPMPPSSMEARDWARVLHERQVAASEEARSVVVCQFAALESNDADPVALALTTDGDVYERLLALLYGVNHPAILFDGVAYAEEDGNVTFFTDGRLEFCSNQLESDLANTEGHLMVAWLYQKLRAFAALGAAFYAAAGYGGILAFDWSLLPRPDIAVWVAGGRAPRVGRARYGQSLIGSDVEGLTEPALRATRLLARIRGPAPDEWLGPR